MTTHPGDPATIGSFAIQARLGRGAMGAVYLARSPGGRLVAVKVVRDELAGDDGFRARFAREIEAARKVSGAFTAAVVDADPDADHPWLATEYLPGPTLQKAIDTSGPLTPGGVRSLAGGLAEALSAIHRSGLVHRDLKPSNIVLTDNGPRVIDFGIARALEDASLTATGVVIGTPGYLSPEQVTGTAIGPPSDMFALGSVLVFAASGRGPFANGNPASLLHRIVHEQPQIPPLPDPLQDLVRRCLARDPAHRPTPLELLETVGSRANTVVVAPPIETIALRPPPPPPTVDPVVHEPTQAGATFTSSRARPMTRAAIAFLIACAFAGWSSAAADQSRNWEAAVTWILAVIAAIVAIRNIRLGCRRRVELHLLPQGLSLARGYQEASVPWSAVTRLRIVGDVRRPWLVAWLDAHHQATLPTTRRRHHGGHKIYPIAHERSVKRRAHQLNELQAALNWYAGHLHDSNY